LRAQLARFYHWGPREAEDLTGAEMQWWSDQANVMVEREHVRK
jgi:hypothetical protein